LMISDPSRLFFYTLQTQFWSQLLDKD
jgi:hypothetical protein